MSAPRKRRTLVSARKGSCSIVGVAACGVDAADDASGGVDEPMQNGKSRKLILNAMQAEGTVYKPQTTYR